MTLHEHPQASDYELSHAGYREIDVPRDNNETIRLVAPDTAYAPQSVAWLSDPEIFQYMGADFSHISLDGEIRRLEEILNNQDAYNWMIECQGRIVGNACINSIDEQTKDKGHKAGTMAILIGEKELWNQRIGRDVNKAIINWAFTEGGFEELHARIMEQNIGSQKSFEKLGFVKTSEEDGNDRRWLHFSMTKDQWQRISQ